jgi:O-Antigen ligase
VWRPAPADDATARPRAAVLGPQIARLDAIAGRFELPILLAIVATIPLEFTKLWFPVTWIDVSRIGIAVALAITVVHALAGTLRLPRVALLGAIALVAAVDILSFLLTRWPLGTKEAASTAIYAGFTIFVAHVLTARRAAAPLAVTLMASAVVVAISSLAEEAGNFGLWPSEFGNTLGRRSGTFGDPNIAARFFAIALIIVLAAFAAFAATTIARRASGVSESSGRRRLILGLVAIGAIAAILGVADVLTLSRIGWLSAVVALVLWLPIAFERRLVGVGMLAFVLAFVGYLALAPTASNRASSVAADAITRIGAGDAGGDDILLPDLTLPADPTAVTPLDGVIERLPLDSVRRYLIRAGVAMTFDHPLFGVGVGGFDGELRSEYWKYVPIDRRGSPTTLLHTDVMRVIAETGLIGLAAWVLLLACAAATVVRAMRSAPPGVRLTAWAAGTGLVVILLASQFAGRFYTEPYLWLALGTLLAVAGFPPDPVTSSTDAIG